MNTGPAKEGWIDRVNFSVVTGPLLATPEVFNVLRIRGVWTDYQYISRTTKEAP